MNQAATIADQFNQAHQVEVKSKGAFPSWHSKWIVDGLELNTGHVKKMLIPIVRKMAGPSPKILKETIWKLLIQCS